MDIQFKVYAQLGDGKEEIRRFSIEKGVVKSYEYLKAKLEDVYPALRRHPYKVYWQDSEGDKIIISSDSELDIALGNLLSSLYKLYVETERAANDCDKDIEIDVAFVPPCVGLTGEGDIPLQEGITGNKHYGFVCDGCEGEVVGYRYRCTVCRDFDLCAKCEADGKHPQHCMLRIPSPLEAYHHGRRFKRSRHIKNLFTEEHCTERKAEATECPFMKKQKRDRAGEGRHHRHGERRARTSWLDTVATYMNEFANLAGDAATAATHIPTTSTQAPPTTSTQPSPTTSTQPLLTTSIQVPPTTSTQVPRTSSTEATTTQTSSTSASTQAQTTNAENGEEMPRHSNEVPILPNIQLEQLITPQNMKFVLEIQKTLANILLPQVPNAANSQDKSQSTVNPPNQSSETVNPPNQSSETVSNATEPSTQTINQVSEASTQNVNQASQSDVPMSQPEAASSSRNVSPEKNDGWTMINNDNDLLDLPVPPPTPSAPVDSRPPIGFKELPQQFNDKVNISETPRIYPNVHGDTAIPLPPPFAPRPPPQATMEPHPAPHVQAALQQMLNMGYTNDGGWLSQLLEGKDGNINAVLDLLTPVVKKN